MCYTFFLGALFLSHLSQWEVGKNESTDLVFLIGHIFSGLTSGFDRCDVLLTVAKNVSVHLLPMWGWVCLFQANIFAFLILRKGTTFAWRFHDHFLAIQKEKVTLLLPSRLTWKWICLVAKNNLKILKLFYSFLCTYVDAHLGDEGTSWTTWN